MRVSPMLLCCWPGLPRLWIVGDWSALAGAIAFGAALNFLIVSTWEGIDLLSAGVGVWAWLFLGGWWLFAAIRAYRGLPTLIRRTTVDQESLDNLDSKQRGLFIQAQGEYLRGNWFEAESLLKQLLRISRQDVDARLCLATLYRRTRRYEEAWSELKSMA